VHLILDQDLSFFEFRDIHFNQFKVTGMGAAKWVALKKPLTILHGRERDKEKDKEKEIESRRRRREEER